MVQELYDAFPGGVITRSKHGRFPHEMADPQSDVYVLLKEAHRLGGTRMLVPRRPAVVDKEAAARAAEADESAARSASTNAKPIRSSFKVARKVSVRQNGVSFQ